MKNFISLLLVLCLMSIGSIKAAECGGTFYYSPETNSDYVAAVIDALYNCCEGETITMYNLDTDESWPLVIPKDGPNANCTPTPI